MEDTVGAGEGVERENSGAEAELLSAAAGQATVVSTSRGMMGPPPPKASADVKAEFKAMGPPPARPRPKPELDGQGGEGGLPSTSGSVADDVSKGKVGMMLPPPPPVAIDKPKQIVEAEAQLSPHLSGTGHGSQGVVEVAVGGGVTGEGSIIQPREKSGRMPVNPPYVKPAWSANPQHPLYIEVLKEGSIVDNLDVSVKAAYMFGRSDACDFVMEHPTSSRFHAVLQYKHTGEAFIYDLGSTHGTFVNKSQVEPKVYVLIRVGDILRFGLSSRLYVVQGPTELMPQESLSKSQRAAQRALEMALERRDQVESVQRAKSAVVASEGITWGMQEDAEEEEEEENLDEITWRTHKGQLTEKQQKTLEKVHKRLEKLANLKKEIDAIQAKEIAQGGLTQGQQTQIARNEQRIQQLMEELETLEETVNESIRESLGARSSKGDSKKASAFDEEDGDSSDDEFYNRAGGGKAKKKDESGEPKVETAETLLEKRSSLLEAMERVKDDMKSEDKKKADGGESTDQADRVDPLDAFMMSVSQDMEKDKTTKLMKKMEILQAEVDRVERLLKIADPTKEALRKWEARAKSSQGERSVSNASLIASRAVRRSVAASDTSTTVPSPNGMGKPPDQQKTESRGEKAGEENVSPGPAGEVDAKVDNQHEVLEGPLWLGAPRPAEKEATITKVPGDESNAGEGFVEYKDRHKEDVLAAPSAEPAGLILQKKPAAPQRKENQQAAVSEERLQDAADTAAADAVALLLRHKGGLALAVEKEAAREAKAKAKKAARQVKKRKLGSEKPSEEGGEDKMDLEAWVPPAGQTGDGRTALNDKFGY